MSRGNFSTKSSWPMLLGLVAFLIVVVAFALVIYNNRGGSPSSSPTAQVSPTTDIQPSATIDILSAKATIAAVINETSVAAPQTPPQSSLATATLDTNPTTTPNFGDAPRAGAGVIVSNPTIPGNWGRVAINMWVEIPKGIVVYAGGTADPSQGAVFILLPGDKIYHPK